MMKRQFIEGVTLRGITIGFALPILYRLIRYIAQRQVDHKKQWVGKRFVGIELGGTNFNVAISQPILSNDGKIINFNIIQRKNGITYADPEQSLQEIITFIRQNQPKPQVNQKNTPVQYYFIGIASFGPLCLDKSSPNYGSITTTPKQLWRGINVLNKVKDSFNNVKVGIDTDVNAAAYAEFKLGNHSVRQSLAYITVGTGVGVGVIAQGKTVHGLTHPEGGHIIVQRSTQEYQHFNGNCPYHKQQTCLESMVSNKSIAERLKVDFTALAEISDDSKVWKLVGFYLAQLCLSITLLLSPQIIVIGGGIMNRKLLFQHIHRQFITMLSGYVEHPKLSKENIHKYIVPPALGSDVGVKGAMILATLQ